MRTKLVFLAVIAAAFSAACQSNVFKSPAIAPATLREVPSVKLGFRYEGDVPQPATASQNAVTEELNPAVRADFDGNRSADLLAKTIISPDNKRTLVAYSRAGDLPDTFRLDMYGADGKFLRRVSPDSMADDFLDSIVWSPDSTSVAFVAITRSGGSSLSTMPMSSNSNSTVPALDSNSNTALPVEPTAEATPAPAPPPNVLTFRTEQIYICTAEGTDVKPITQTENLIYYYFVWSPDSSMLAALATRLDEWRYLMAVANQAGEKFVPVGRPRIIEKNGRERTLDDSPTKVHPVWSPDSGKVAVAFDKPAQIRVYDAIGNAPTQAAIPLRNPLLISSQAYDRAKDNQAEQNSNVAPVVDPNAAQDVTTLPNEKDLVSFQPIIGLDWSADSNLYFQTGFVREYLNSSEDRFSSLRWHRLVLSAQGSR
ncbi:MAG: hypothetical protein IPK58_05565 [Acidobacteria bacterium]|nr:hypothetical protein [Acidobacteriota bacterium]